MSLSDAVGTKILTDCRQDAQKISHCGDPWTVLEQNLSLNVSLDVTDVAIRTALTCYALLAIFSTQSEKKIRKYPIISDF